MYVRACVRVRLFDRRCVERVEELRRRRQHQLEQQRVLDRHVGRAALHAERAEQREQHRAGPTARLLLAPTRLHANSAARVRTCEQGGRGVRA
eukprot:6195005-Pleurochrysis_carterae.AAC.1